ncbi:hypothetical protein NQZ68_013087 [Dissostichus eleginoides]|nr:hypothetical protein NQZ68_013087 [Dissostichus eleginoides]
MKATWLLTLSLIKALCPIVGPMECNKQCYLSALIKHQPVLYHPVGPGWPCVALSMGTGFRKVAISDVLPLLQPFFCTPHPLFLQRMKAKRGHTEGSLSGSLSSLALLRILELEKLEEREQEIKGESQRERKRGCEGRMEVGRSAGRWTMTEQQARNGGKSGFHTPAKLVSVFNRTGKECVVALKALGTEKMRNRFPNEE